ncbi:MULTISPECIES: intracellular growth attenuator family protein [Dickeya]|uniref:Intracellular growth attenuator protein igaA n=1 Tax=Dickeya aquatica TaxID=1401087 RepID=A0A375AGA9_9GAMM|nr:MULTISPECIES: intracellular growth attenuator family protein [Dickeya]SLM64901.1 bacterial intracellular growth attenuator (IgaA) protein family. IgaA is involved in negative control of bacterial proliferation within fibroblasts. IgaA is homologous to the Escherichia coli YrfF and Proteus mirabilis UmoB proteins. Whereas the biological function of YrfF is currently unknown, UmoB has been shown elsewhere to act as a positive regulator of FlhDC, the master regulator of flagella and swarming. FlhD
MSTILIILAVLFACLMVSGGVIGYLMYRRLLFAKRLPVTPSGHRQLTASERIAIERYLAMIHPDGTTTPSLPVPASRLPRLLPGNRVYPITHSITRYGLSTDAPNKWRYYIDTQEVHLPARWEQFITQNNEIELIKTRSMPLVISLNGHSLTEFIHELDGATGGDIPGEQASIRPEVHEHTELVAIRKETPEEHAVHRSRGLREAAVLSLAFILLVFSLTSPLTVLFWLAAAACTMVVWGCWQLLRPASQKELREVHCLNGTPQCMGLFSDTSNNPINNVSLGNIDLIYPPHWQPYIGYDLGTKTDVDIYLNRQVVRQGKYLSLHNEVKFFPLQHWGKNAVLATGALVSLVLLLTSVPLDLPLKLSLAWVQGAENIKVTQVEELEHMALHVGDKLQVRGSGMCYVPPAPAHSVNKSAFAPFDCAGIYWNKAAPLPLPESDVIDKTAALQKTVQEQLHPAESDNQVSAQLADAIQKSGMILLNNFSDIVLKTDALCEREEDCTRLKNALANLGNAKNWDSLVKRARSGALKGMNVVLRPVSAESLESLVKNATDDFYNRETKAASSALNSPSPGGFLLHSDEGRQFVNHPPPPTPLRDFPPQEQWQELLRLSAMLLHTPFEASGVITQLSIDANGTRHISLHSEPDAVTMWRSLGVCVLLLAFSVILILNLVLVVVKRRRSQQRIANIQQYYARHLVPEAPATGNVIYGNVIHS